MADAVFAELFLSRQECKDFAKIRESVQEQRESCFNLRKI